MCVLMGVGEQVGKACFSPSVNSRTRETTMAFGVIDPNCPEAVPDRLHSPHSLYPQAMFSQYDLYPIFIFVC